MLLRRYNIFLFANSNIPIVDVVGGVGSAVDWENHSDAGIKIYEAEYTSHDNQSDKSTSKICIAVIGFIIVIGFNKSNAMMPYIYQMH